MDEHKTPPMKKPSSHNFYETAYKLLANPDIIPTAKFIAALTKSPENNQEDDKLRNDSINLFRFCSATFPGCLSLKLIRVYSSRDPRFPHDIREKAIKFLYLLLSEQEEASLNLIIVEELSPLLITCLAEQVNSDTSFKILSKIVNRIASEIFTVHEATWNDLRDYISSRAETEFAKSVFVFKSLSMPLDGEEFVVPVMENLLPAIMKRLGDEEESELGLAFVGGFCAAIHLLETTRVDLVEDLVYEMLESVNRGKELGFLEKALREVEMIVVKQLGWYCTTEFRFVSGLIRRIAAFSGGGITEETVLKRIKMIVEKKTLKSLEEIDNGDADWLNKRH